MKVRANALRLKIRPDCKYTLAFDDFANPSSDTGGSYQRPLDQLGMAVAEAVGHSGTEFMMQFTASRQESIARTIDASPVAGAVLEWFERHPYGRRSSAKALMGEIEHFRPTYCDAWPKSAKGFADALRRAAPALRQLGGRMPVSRKDWRIGTVGDCSEGTSDFFKSCKS
jgi:hypothetical protein